MKKALLLLFLAAGIAFVASSCVRSKASCKKGHKTKKAIDRIQYQ